MSKKGRSFPPRHERPRDDPSSGGGRRPFPTKPTSTTSHPARRLASSSKLLKSSIPLPSSLRINGRRLTFTIYCNPHDEASIPAFFWPPKSWIGSRIIYADDQVRRISDSAATNLPVFRSPPDEKFLSYPKDKVRLPCVTLALVWNRYIMALPSVVPISSKARYAKRQVYSGRQYKNHSRTY